MDTSVQAARHFQWSLIVYTFAEGSSSEDVLDTPLTTVSLVSLDSIVTDPR